MSFKKIELEPLEEPESPELPEFPLSGGHAHRIKKGHQIGHFLPQTPQTSLKIEEIHQISNALAPKSEIFGEVWTQGPFRDLRESGDDEIKEGEPRNAVARRIKRNRELRAVESKGDYVPNNHRPPPPKKRVNRPLWERQMEILELERKMPVIPAVIIPRPTSPPPSTHRRCSICFKRTDTITIKGVFQLVLITGQMLSGKKSIQQANIFLSDSENFVCKSHLKESVSEIFRILGIEYLRELQTCSKDNANRLMVTVNSLYPKYNFYFFSRILKGFCEML